MLIFRNNKDIPYLRLNYEKIYKFYFLILKNLIICWNKNLSKLKIIKIKIITKLFKILPIRLKLIAFLQNIKTKNKVLLNSGGLNS